MCRTLSPRPDYPFDEIFDEPTPADLLWWEEMAASDLLFERGYFDG